MAFKYDELSCGYHPDYCSTCEANSCHGPCVCPVEYPEVGRVCEYCSGTGCPKCGCEPAPQQTFLSHSRMSFPKCTCDSCPKKCPKCCRNRIPCDCLPTDICRYDHVTGEVKWSDSEEDMSVDESTEESMDIEDSPAEPHEAGDQMVNQNNSGDKYDCQCDVTVMDTCEPDNKPSQKKVEPKPRKRKSVRRIPSKVKSINKTKKSTTYLNKQKRRRQVKRLKRTRSAKIPKKVTKKKPLKTKSDSRVSRPKKEQVQKANKTDSMETLPAPQETLKDNKLEFAHQEGSSGESSDNSGGEWNSEEEQGETEEWPKEDWPKDEPAEETDRLFVDEECRVSQKSGPCLPPPPVMSNLIKEQIANSACDKNCEKPCLEGIDEDPCNPRPVCVCNRTCQKEFHMMVDGTCVRCAPPPKEDDPDYCQPCDRKKLRINDKIVEEERDFCDDSEPCVDDCTQIFGECPPKTACPGECNSGECENPCIIM